MPRDRIAPTVILTIGVVMFVAALNEHNGMWAGLSLSAICIALYFAREHTTPIYDIRAHRMQVRDVAEATKNDIGKRN